MTDALTYMRATGTFLFTFPIGPLTLTQNLVNVRYALDLIQRMHLLLN